MTSRAAKNNLKVSQDINTSHSRKGREQARLDEVVANWTLCRLSESNVSGGTIRQD